MQERSGKYLGFLHFLSFLSYCRTVYARWKRSIARRWIVKPSASVSRGVQVSMTGPTRLIQVPFNKLPSRSLLLKLDTSKLAAFMFSRKVKSRLIMVIRKPLKTLRIWRSLAHPGPATPRPCPRRIWRWTSKSTRGSSLPQPGVDDQPFGHGTSDEFQGGSSLEFQWTYNSRFMGTACYSTACPWVNSVYMPYI